MLDKNGRKIKAGDRLEGSFYGQGGWWYEYATVRESTDPGLYLEFDDGRISCFSHPKFCKASRREVQTESVVLIRETAYQHFERKSAETEQNLAVLLSNLGVE